MRTLAIALATTTYATAASAGSLSEPTIEAPVIVAETTASSAGGEALVLFLTLIMTVAAVAD